MNNSFCSAKHFYSEQTRALSIILIMPPGKQIKRSKEPVASKFSKN